MSTDRYFYSASLTTAIFFPQVIANAEDGSIVCFRFYVVCTIQTEIDGRFLSIFKLEKIEMTGK